MNKILFPIQIGFLLFVTGCAASVDNVPYASATLPIRSTRPVATYTPTILAISLTPTITSTPSSTRTLTRKPSPIVPTLLPTDQAKLEFEFVSTNHGCKLPCWWGIQPSVSGWQTLDSIYAYLRTGVLPESLLISTTTPMPDDYKRRSIFLIANHFCYAMLNFEDNDTGIIQNIQMTVDYPATYGGNECAKALRPYFMDNILINYGKPSRILMEAHAVTYEPNGPHLYDIWLFYDDLGILAHYEGEHSIAQGVIQICPQYNTAWTIGLFLRAPGKPLNLDETNYSYFDQGRSDEYIKSIENATDLTVETFYEKFAVRDVQRCFKTAASLWQEP